MYWKRLLVEVLLLRDKKLRSNGEVMLSEGLSVPLNDSLVSYRNTQTEAEQHQDGVYGVFPPEVANMACMKPEALRVQFPELVVHEGETYSVTGNSPLRNESHVFVRKSSIPGAETDCSCVPVLPVDILVRHGMRCSYKPTLTCVFIPMR